jgi:divalent metal cation (Fe/Co/Zn/Cd) transporter
MKRIFDWLGFGGQQRERGPSASAHDQSGGSHGHTHGVIDATIATTTRGIWAIKWSFIILAITSALQITVVIATGSVALLADTIHNVGDATTAIPLWIAFIFARRKPSKTFTYGYGRVEDLAGILIVLIILFSAVIAGWVKLYLIPGIGSSTLRTSSISASLLFIRHLSRGFNSR